MPTAGATTKLPTHDLTFEDVAGTKIGITLCDRKGNHDPNQLREEGIPRSNLIVSESNEGYGNAEYPYSAIVQSDWSGGRGKKEFDEDTSRYWDGYRVDTIRGRVILGPKETYSTGAYKVAQTITGTENNGPISSLTIVSAITPSATFTARRIRVRVTPKPASGSPRLRAKIYSDSGGSGSPNVLQATGDWRTLPVGVSDYIYMNLPISCSLTSGTKYWIGFEIDNSGYCYVKQATSAGNKVYIYNGSWTGTADKAIEVYARSDGEGGAYLLEYLGAMYSVTRPDDYSAPKIFLNGYRGAALDNSSDKTKLNTSLNLSGVDLTGKIACIISGPGSQEPQNWRKILSNTTAGTNDSITVDGAWNITHTTSTEYVIKGCDTWQEITGANQPTKPITDKPLVVNDIVYFCQGSEAYIARMRYNAGSHTFAAESVYGNTLCAISDTYGIKKIWRALGADALSAPVVAWGTALTWGTAISCGNSDERINRIIGYGVPTIPFVFKDGAFGTINNGIYAEYPLSEMRSVKSDNNGRVAFRMGVFLYFTLGQGLERFYNGSLDDVGPNLNDGLPEARKGPVSAGTGYPGRYYLAIDAGGGYDRYSGIQCHNGTGYCEIYRAPAGQRIRDIHIEAVPGQNYQRLWICEEESLLWLPVTMDDPRGVTGYQFTDTGYVISGWKYAGKKTIEKYLATETLFIGNATADLKATAKYQADTGDDAGVSGVDITGTFDTQPSEELVIRDLGGGVNAHGKRARTKITLSRGADASLSPELEAEVMKVVMRDEVKSMWVITFSIEDYPLSGNGGKSAMTAKEQLDQLKTWSNGLLTPAPLLMKSNRPPFDSRYVFISPASVQIIGSTDTPTHITQLICSMTISQA